MTHKYQCLLSSSPPCTDGNWLACTPRDEGNDNGELLKLSYKKLLSSFSLLSCCALREASCPVSRTLDSTSWGSKWLETDILLRGLELGTWAFWQKGLPAPGGMPLVATVLPVPWLLAQKKLWIRGAPTNLTTTWRAGIVGQMFIAI